MFRSLKVIPESTFTQTKYHYNFQVHAILKALPANTQNEKRELDNDAVKEQETEKEATDKADDTTETKTTAETTKEK